MNNTVKTLEIQEIIFESNDPEVLVKGRMFDGVLSYLSQITINHTQLNLLLGKIRSINEDINLDDLFEEEPMYNGDSMFVANLQAVGFVKVNTRDFDFRSASRKIRA